MTKAEQHQVPGLLTDDQAACSFTDDSIYQLSTITVPGSGSGRDLGQLVGTVTLWATADALSAIEQIQVLDSDRSDRHALKVLASDEKLLGSDRAQAEAELAAADKVGPGPLARPGPGPGPLGAAPRLRAGSPEAKGRLAGGGGSHAGARRAPGAGAPRRGPPRRGANGTG